MQSPRRVLFTFAGRQGHLIPLLGLASVLREAGHETALSGRYDVVAGRSDFDELFPVDPDVSTGIPEAAASAIPAADQSTGLLAPPDFERELRAIADHFVNKRGTPAVGRITALIERWRPHLLVCDEMDFGAMVAAEKAGVPVVVVNVIASGALTRPAYVTAALERLRESVGLEPGPDAALAMLNGALLVSPAPPSFRDPLFPLPLSAVSVQPGTGVVAGAAVTESANDEDAAQPRHPAIEWLRAGGDCTRIYVTLGTIFNTESGDLFARILHGVVGLRGPNNVPVRVLATVGGTVNPASIGIAAENLRIERYVPQDLVLPFVDVAVNHGGSGSVIGALGQGVPLIVIAMGADQELNAARVEAMGVGVALHPIQCDADAVAAAVRQVLALGPAASEGISEMVSAARRVQSEIRALPVCASLLPALEKLANPAAKASG